MWVRSGLLCLCVDVLCFGVLVDMVFVLFLLCLLCDIVCDGKRVVGFLVLCCDGCFWLIFGDAAWSSGSLLGCVVCVVLCGRGFCFGVRMECCVL